MIETITVRSVTEYLKQIEIYITNWTHDGFAKPWYRGLTNIEYKLFPSILRNGNDKYEFNITKKFRLVAPGYSKTPETNRMDQWLFIMQHHEVPTRLLDWSESPLIAAFFATQKAIKLNNKIENDAAIYALDPIELNKLSNMNYFPNTWVQNEVLQTIKFAFGTQNETVNNQVIPYLEYPVAIYPSIIHSRIKTQKGCFTLHGSDKRDFESIFQNNNLIIEKKLIKFIIPKDCIINFFAEINHLGITYSSLFQNLDGLSKDLKYEFGIDY